MTFDQLSVFIENKPGKLLEALEILASADIDMRALSLADTENFGILRIIVNKTKAALEVLQEADYLVKISEVIAVEISDRPGGFAEILRFLTNAGVQVEYTYAFFAHSHDIHDTHDKAYVILRVTDNDVAVKILSDNSVKLLSNADL